MIISASRRTDIPAFYSKWFINRIRAGWCQVPNPLNYHQLSYISLRPEDVEAIVFWSKNPSPMLIYLDELDSMGFHYYFQFTLNAYDHLLEPEVPPISERIKTFKYLSGRLGKQRIIWRYDPILISNLTPPNFHLEKFSIIAQLLKGYNNRVMISFADYYLKTIRRLNSLEEDGYIFEKDASNSDYAWNLMKDISSIAQANDMDIYTCAEERDFSKAGVPPGRCIDGELINKLWSLHIDNKKDPTQRESCLCVISKDIGINDTCIHGCQYCYSTRNLTLAKRRHSIHDPNSPVLWGKHRELSENEQANQQKTRLL
jgi:hypothetical protein